MKIKYNTISSNLLVEKEVTILIKRIDLNHRYISGNKLYKLKYNITEAKKKGYKKILTFGGAYSNHIVATAYLGKKEGFNTIGIIRGEKNLPLNASLQNAYDNEMNLKYINRRDYRLKDTDSFINKLKCEFGNFYLIPEGGTNFLGVKGASEILSNDNNYNYVCCPVGTGGTIAGIINSSNINQIILGFSALKNTIDVKRNIKLYTKKQNWKLFSRYSCGGYAKISKKLIKFINEFNINYGVPLDVIYTGKMMMGLFDMVERDFFKPKSKILVVHTGGLQGNKGMNQRLKLNLPEKY
ncbi:MAG: 1-aminocyclopropane-1-carboxylate deaminase [Flavobacteriales bacterium]|nr:1-aminocyclopropane-1-carboxylate deaminase [Flavobacteriales bacterium]